MSPILLRPIREQIEHDRVIRQLQARWRRRYEVAINTGQLEEASVRAAGKSVFPDVILTDVDGGRRLHAVIEVETAESVNHLEAMAQWGPFSKARSAFYLYVPAGFSDVALRLCQGSKINVTEIWTYYAIGDQVRFSMTYRSPRAKAALANAKSKPKPKPKPAQKSKARTAKGGKATKPAGQMKKGKTAKSAKSTKKKATKKTPAGKSASKRAPAKKTRATGKAKKKK